MKRHICQSPYRILKFRVKYGTIPHMSDTAALHRMQWPCTWWEGSKIHFVVIIFCLIILRLRLNLNYTQFSPHSTVNMYHSQNQQVNAVYGNNCCLVWKPYTMHKYTLLAKHIIFFKVKPGSTQSNHWDLQGQSQHTNPLIYGALHKFCTICQPSEPQSIEEISCAN